MRLEIVIALGVGLLPVYAGAPGPNAPTGLRCEYLANPEGIDSQSPRLSWLIHDARRGAKQTAYQIQVASSAGPRYIS
jgi:alpha-L-rhamnosidase